jgi:hypothetical protein
MSDADPPKPVDLSKLVHIDFTTIVDPEPTDQAQLGAVNKNPLLVPAFVYGEHAQCRRKMKAEAKKWAKRFEEGRDFPEPKMIEVPPGSILICDSGDARMIAFGASSRKPCWFFYLVDEMHMEANPGTPEARKLFQPKFEAFACRYPWGALSLAISAGGSLTIPIVVQRLEAVLSFWEQLDTVRYLRFQKYTLNELMLYFYYGVLNMWIGGPRKSMRDSLRAAIDQMRNASEDEIQTRMMRYFHWLIDNYPKLQHREWLKTPGLLERELAITKETDPDSYEGKKTGQWLESYLEYLEEYRYPKSK